MIDRDQLAAHLDFLRELGVHGVSRAPEWRARVATAAPAARAGMDEETAPMDEGIPAAAAVSAEDGLPALRAEIGPDCTRCKLHTLGRRQVVFGAGHPRARLMFVGEAPGEDEDKQGEPFVGRAGQLLTKIIEAIGMTREQVYIANVIKCRPPHNRNPDPVEIAQCEPWLLRQVELLQPRIIVALGRFAAHTLLAHSPAFASPEALRQLPLGKLRGRVHEVEIAGRRLPLVVSYHPAYLLRQPADKAKAWDDLCLLAELLEQPPGG